MKFYGLELKAQEVKYRALNSFQYFFFHFFLFVSSVKSILGPMASTATLEYGPNILIAHGTTKGGGGAGPLRSKRLLKGTFFFGTPP